MTEEFIRGDILCPHCLREYRIRRIDETLVKIDQKVVTPGADYHGLYKSLIPRVGYTQFTFSCPLKMDIYGNAVLLGDKTKTDHGGEWNFQGRGLVPEGEIAEHPDDLQFLTESEWIINKYEGDMHLWKPLWNDIIQRRMQRKKSVSLNGWESLELESVPLSGWKLNLESPVAVRRRFKAGLTYGMIQRLKQRSEELQLGEQYVLVDGLEL